MLRFFAFLGVFIFHAAPRTVDFYNAAGISALAEQLAHPDVWRGRVRRGSIFRAERLSDYQPAAARAGRHGSAGPARLLSAAHSCAYGRCISRLSRSRRYSRRWFPGSICPCDMLSATACWRETGSTSSTACLRRSLFRCGPSRLKSNSIWRGRWRCAKRQCARWRPSRLEYWWSPIAWRVWLAVSAAPVERIEYNTFTRLDPIAFGILIALFGHKLPPFTRCNAHALLCGGVADVDCGVRVHALPVIPLRFTTWQMALGHPFTALASAAVLLSVLGAQHPFLRNKVLLYLGKISYGLYVLHEFAHFCAIRLVPASTPHGVFAQSIVGLALTILLAAASYRWLESPFLRLKERFAHVQSRPV